MEWIDVDYMLPELNQLVIAYNGKKIFMTSRFSLLEKEFLHQIFAHVVNQMDMNIMKKSPTGCLYLNLQKNKELNG